MVYKYVHTKSKKSLFPVPIYSIYYCEEAQVLVIGLNGEIVSFELSPTIMSQLVANGDTCPFNFRQSYKIHTDVIHKIVGFNRRIFTASYDRTVQAMQLMDLTVSKQVCKLSTAPSAMICEKSSQAVILGDLSGNVRSYSVDGLYLGTLAEGIPDGVTCIYSDLTLRVLWIVARSGEIHLVDPLHAGQNLADNFQMFKDLPQAGSPTASYEVILGNGLGSRISAIVNHKYVFSWRWEPTAYISKFQLPNKPVNAITVFDYNESDPTYFSKPPPKRAKKSTFVAPPMEKRVNSSIVSPGLNVFAGGSSIVALRPASHFLYQSDELHHMAGVCALDFCYQEVTLVAGTRAGQVLAVSFDVIRSESVPHTEGCPVLSVYAFDGSALSVAGEDRSVALWRVRDGLSLLKKRERTHEKALTATAFSRVTHELYTGDDAGFVRAWRVDEEDVRESFLIDHSQFGPITWAAVSSMDDLLLFATEDGFVRAWPRANLLSAACFTFSVSPCCLTAMAAGPDNDVLVATDDKTIRLVSLSTREEKAIFAGHTDLITQIVVPKGPRWMSLQWDGQVFFWAKLGAASAFSTQPRTPAGSAIHSPKLPKLTPSRPPERAAMSQSTPVGGGEQLISIYEKNRKALLLKRREQERAVRAERRSPQYHRIMQIQAMVQKTIKELDERRKQRAQTSLQ